MGRLKRNMLRTYGVILYTSAVTYTKKYIALAKLVDEGHFTTEFQIGVRNAGH